MIKIISLLVIIAIVTSSATPIKTGPPSTTLPVPRLVRNASPVTEAQNEQFATTTAPEVGISDDMAKAETFGFGYHQHIYVAPQYGDGYYGGNYGGYYPYRSYYPNYGYGQGYGYPC
ncbi:uncharacterized protein LOC134215320 [Armigeres subalbatus]|uniref:uncharacterized protein LOC134215320 n=1 Tax=Armigeres subalbatus TaxID=124917 RepID=UPI002ED35CCA